MYAIGDKVTIIKYLSRLVGFEFDECLVTHAMGLTQGAEATIIGKAYNVYTGQSVYYYLDLCPGAFSIGMFEPKIAASTQNAIKDVTRHVYGLWPITKSTPVAPIGCIHDSKEYFGLNERFNYCTKCGDKV